MTRSFKDMPNTFEYKGHTYCKTFWSSGYISNETGMEMFKYYYAPDDDRMFLWVDSELNPSEDLFDYDQFLDTEDPGSGSKSAGTYEIYGDDIAYNTYDSLNRVYEKALAADGFVWFICEDETDENGNTVMFHQTEDGSLELVSDNVFAHDEFMEYIEMSYCGKKEVDFLCDSVKGQIDDISSDRGWQRPLHSLLEDAEQADNTSTSPSLSDPCNEKRESDTER